MKYTGSVKSVQLPERRIWDPRSGWQIGYRYLGPTEDLVLLEFDARNLGRRTELDPHPQGGRGMLTIWVGAEATQAPDQPLVDRWTLAGNDLEKSLLEHPDVLAAFPDTNPQARANLRSDLDDVMSGEKTVQEMLDATTDPTQQAMINLLVNQMSLGVEAFTVSQFVLRRVLIIAANSSIKPSLEHVGEIYTTAELVQAETVPGTIRFELPEGYWLKRTPTVDQMSLDKWQITQEWWHADAYGPFYHRVNE